MLIITVFPFLQITVGRLEELSGYYLISMALGVEYARSGRSECLFVWNMLVWIGGF